MTDESTFGAAELERVLIDALMLTADAELIDRPDWAQLSTPSLAEPSRNGVYLARMSESDADARIAEVKQRYLDRGAGFRWVVGPSSTPADLSARLERAGIGKLATALGMVMAVPAEIPAVPEGLLVRPIEHDDIELYGQISMRAWERGPDFQRECERVAKDALAHEPCQNRMWLVYDRAEPVGIAVLTLLAKVGYFQGAAILPERRRQGFYQALLHHRLAVLRELGIEHAVIWADESTSAGVCSRVGFVPRCRAVFHEVRQ